MKWKVLLPVGFVVILVLGALQLLPFGHQAPDIDQSRSRTSENGMFTVALEPETGTIEIGPLHAFILTVATQDGQTVSEATIEIGGGMPDHDHGLATQPEITAALGEGRYRVEGVKFTMEGWWQLRFDISTAAGDDAVVFNIVL